MALSTAVGTINIPASSTSAITETVGFQVSFVIFYWSGRTEGTDTEGSDHIEAGIGFAGSDGGTITQMCNAINCEDGASTSNTDCWCDTSHVCIETAPTGAAVKSGTATIGNITSTSFDITPDDAFVRSRRLSYFAVGGTGVNAGVFSMNTANGTGNETFTTTGIDPVAVLTSVTRSTGAAYASARLSIGAATGTAEEAVVWGASRNARSTTETLNYGYGDQVGAGDRDTINDVGWAAEFVSFGTGQWTFNTVKNTGNQSQRMICLVIEGCEAEAFDFVTATNTTAFDGPTLGGTPDGVFLFSSCEPENSASSPTNGDQQTSLGAAVSATERTCHAWADEDAATTTRCYTAVDYDAVYINPDIADSQEGRMDINSWGNPISYIMEDADPSAAFVGGIAFWETAGGATTPKGPLGHPLYGALRGPVA